jgi:hypothetical protein
MANPYQPPADAPVVAAGDLSRLLRVAQNQRAIMFCILASMGVAGASATLKLAPIVAAIPTLLVGLVSLAFTFRLASVVYSKTGAIVCGLLIVVATLSAFVVLPALSQLTVLVILFVVNSRATKELKAAGFRVGLLGGDPAEVEARMRG